MKIKKVIGVIALLSIVVGFQNCGAPGVTGEGEASSFSSSEIKDAPLVEYVYDFNNIINGRSAISIKSGETHMVSYPYGGVKYYPRDTEKGQIVYFRCSNNDENLCFEELIESGRRNCANLGSFTSKFLETKPSFYKVRRDERYSGSFLLSLKSGELVETKYIYHVCYNITEKLYSSTYGGSATPE